MLHRAFHHLLFTCSYLVEISNGQKSLLRSDGCWCSQQACCAPAPTGPLNQGTRPHQTVTHMGTLPEHLHVVEVLVPHPQSFIRAVGANVGIHGKVIVGAGGLHWSPWDLRGKFKAVLQQHKCSLSWFSSRAGSLLGPYCQRIGTNVNKKSPSPGFTIPVGSRGREVCLFRGKGPLCTLTSLHRFYTSPDSLCKPLTLSKHTSLKSHLGYFSSKASFQNWCTETQMCPASEDLTYSWLFQHLWEKIRWLGLKLGLRSRKMESPLKALTAPRPCQGILWVWHSCWDLLFSLFPSVGWGVHGHNWKSRYF